MWLQFLVEAIRNMSFIDCLLITLFNAVICIILPKVLSLIASKTKVTTPLQPVLTPPTPAKADLD